MPDKDSKYKSLAKDTGLFTISSFGSKILMFLLTPLYTSILATSEYGIADLINTTIQFLYPVLTFAMADATLRYTLDKNENKNEVFIISTFFTFLSTILLLVFKPLICKIDNSLNTYWLVFVINFLLYNIHNYFANFVKGLGRTTLFAVQGLVQTATVVILNVLFLVVFKWGLNGYLLCVVLSYCVPNTIMFFCAKLYNFIYPIRINKKLLSDMLKYSIPMIPTILAWAINTSIDKYMIIGLYGLGASGIYSVAHKIPTIISTLLTVFIQAWQISVISNYGSDDESSYYTNVYKGLDFVCISGGLFIILTCKILANLLFAKDFYAAWQYVPMLVISAMFSSYAGFLAAAYRAAKKTKSLFISVMAGAVLNIILNYILLRCIGVLGAAVATAISFFVVWLVRAFLIQKIVKVDIKIAETAISIVLLFVCATLVTVDFPNVWIVIVLSYIIICYIKRNIIRSVVLSMIGLIKRKRV